MRASRCLRLATGRVLAFGRGLECQTGAGIPTGHHAALEVSGMSLHPGESAVGVVAGHFNTGVLTYASHAAGPSGASADTTPTGRAWVWGRNSSGELGVGSSAIKTVDEGSLYVCRAEGLKNGSSLSLHALSLGQGHSAALTSAGLYTCGAGREGQLGTGGAMGPRGSYHGGQQDEAVHAPVPVIDPFRELQDPPVAVAVSRFLTLILGASGRVYATGSDFHGALGVGPTPYCTSPCLALGLPELDPVVSIAAGLTFSLAVTASGRLFFWGSLGHGGSAGSVGGAAAPVTGRGGGDPSSSPSLRSRAPMELTIPGWTNNGTRAQEEGMQRQNGARVALPGVSHHAPSSPPLHPGPGAALAIHAGLHHAALTDGQRLWTLGLDRFGALGMGMQGEGAVWQPQVVPLPPQCETTEPRITALACGPYATAVVANGSLLMCGRIESPYMLGGGWAQACTRVMEGGLPSETGLGQFGVYGTSSPSIPTGTGTPAGTSSTFLVAPSMVQVQDEELVGAGESVRAVALGAAHAVVLL